MNLWKIQPNKRHNFFIKKIFMKIKICIYFLDLCIIYLLIVSYIKQLPYYHILARNETKVYITPFDHDKNHCLADCMTGHLS